ncbi:uncharacterized protein LOC134842900 [Symsagittifera roscoffensis]|uniref:uncharacterized protein LOC134842900 n=1 Tax=Symsagittifera roscoffensis TaxID=84072 RepID=UPI00307B877E
MAYHSKATALVLLVLWVTFTCPQLASAGEDEDEDDDGLCKSDMECEWWATYVVKSDKHMCCDGHCKETCLSDAALILLFVVLPCVGCILCVGSITGGIMYAIKLGNKKQQVQVVAGPTVGHPVNFQYPAPYPVPGYSMHQHPPPGYMEPFTPVESNQPGFKNY